MTVINHKEDRKMMNALGRVCVYVYVLLLFGERKLDRVDGKAGVGLCK